MKSFAILIMLFVANAAFAVNPQPPEVPPPHEQSQGQLQAQGQLQGQLQGQAQAAVSDSSAVSGDSSASTGPVAVTNDFSREAGSGDTVSYTYQEPPIAMAGFSNNVIGGCKTIIGFDGRHADEDNAAGFSLGIPLPDDPNCLNDKAAVRAFQYGDHEQGWILFCTSPVNWKAIRRANAAERGLRMGRLSSDRKHWITEQEAVDTCLNRHRQEYTDSEVNKQVLAEQQATLEELLHVNEGQERRLREVEAQTGKAYQK